MDDNATCHRTLAVQDCLDSEGIQRLVWPARSPDLNPIENVWDALGRQVAGRNYPPTNKNTLIPAHTEEWDKLPQELLDNVVQSMEIEITQECVGASRFNGPYGRQGCVLARTFESNQGGRFDGNESVADSFRSVCGILFYSLRQTFNTYNTVSTIRLSPGSSTCVPRVRSLNLNTEVNNEVLIIIILRYRSVESHLRVSLVNNGLVGPYSTTVLVTLPSAPDHRPPRLASAR
ncbi:hypothetical protein TNCV_1558081 [Trichonephila clavipes]|uniref:Tc1-like transposase DDE domain-containing protein n=1 Tax=Trichonephila clavipes TaxID=2585209 RepID=A0A8X6R5G7_TRICX|nr:hypothetical protein TNCV_1558081 [Trichonephila clavipes]